MLESTVAEIEAHVHASGWDRGPALFGLVRAAQVTADDPDTAARLGLDLQDGDVLTPIEQDDLPDEPLDEILGGIGWPEVVAGCAVSQEIVVLPPAAQAEIGDDPVAAAAHPDRREARLVVGVLRDGTSAALLRMRSVDPSQVGDDLLTGPDIAPNLVAALLATFE